MTFQKHFVIITELMRASPGGDRTLAEQYFLFNNHTHELCYSRLPPASAQVNVQLLRKKEPNSVRAAFPPHWLCPPLAHNLLKEKKNALLKNSTAASLLRRRPWCGSENSPQPFLTSVMFAESEIMKLWETGNAAAAVSKHNKDFPSLSLWTSI